MMPRSPETVVDLFRRVVDPRDVARLLGLLLCACLALPSSASAQRGERNDRELGSLDGSEEGVQTKWSLPISWDQTVTVNTLNKGAQLTHDPHYIWWFGVAPRWAFSDHLSIGARTGFSYEWTNSVDSEFNRPGFYGRQTLWEDTRLDVRYRLPWEPGGVVFATSGRLRLPTSKFSRSRERILSPGARVDVSKRFSVLEGLSIQGWSEYWGWIAKSNVANLAFDDYPCRLAPGGGGPAIDNCVGEFTAVRQWFRAGIGVSIEPVRRFTIGTRFDSLWGQGYGLSEACTSTLTGPVCIGDGSRNNHWRNFTDFALYLSYEITNYLDGTLEYDTWSQHPDSDGGRENAFYNENTRIVLSFSLRVEDIYKTTKKRRAARRAKTVLAGTP